MDKKINEYFFVLKNEDIMNNEIYFLADYSIFKKFNEKKLKIFNNFTDTHPAFRANFEISLTKVDFLLTNQNIHTLWQLKKELY